MTSEQEQKRLMTRYLLGELSPQEHEQFEDRYLADPDLFEQLSAAEDEMVRSYLRGECSETENAALEKRIAASPDWRQKVEFERSLMEHVSSIPAPGIESADERSTSALASKARGSTWSLVPAFRLAAVAVWIFIIIAGVWLITTNLRLQHELAQAQAEKLDLEHRTAELQQQLALLAANPPLSMPPFVLTTHLVRDTSRQKPLMIPSGISSVPIQLVLDKDTFPSYDAALETPEGNRLWQQKDLKSQTAADGKHLIALDLPANLLPPGTYILKLNGTSPNRKPQEVAVYIFRMAKH
jgi:hypothetical protein